MKTKLFTVVFESIVDKNRVGIDDKINAFLEENDIEVVDIKFSTSVSNIKHISQALLMYNEGKPKAKTKKTEK